MIRHANRCLKEYYNVTIKCLRYIFNCDILDDIVCWNIFYDYFFFKLDPREKDSEWIYVVFFKQEYGVVKMKDLAGSDSSCK